MVIGYTCDPTPARLRTGVTESRAVTGAVNYGDVHYYHRDVTHPPPTTTLCALFIILFPDTLYS